MASLEQLEKLKFLDPHQRDGVNWVLTHPRSYLAHAPGAGKTLEAIVASLMTEGNGQIVFIVPPSLTMNWHREVCHWIGKLLHYNPFVTIIPETKNQDQMDWLWQSDFIICPDSMLSKDWVYQKLIKMKKKFIAVDEASRFKEDSSQRTIALFGGKIDGKEYGGLIKGTTRVVLLDGSPMPNRPMELWAPTFALSPKSIDNMSKEDFGFRYCGAKINDFGRWEFKHASRERELHDKLTKNFMHVVNEDELSHPERKRSLLFMNEDARSPKHKTWERRHLSKISFDEISEDMSTGEMAKFRRELGERKIPWVSNYVAERLQNKNESILLFAWHRDVVLGLAERLSKFNPGVIMGGTEHSSREKSFSLFQSGKKKLLILNIAAGGRGHNLQKADRAIFAEFSWCDETNTQCEKRASRRGRDKDLPVRCDYIVSPGSMDEPVLQAVFRKAESVRKVIG